MVRNALLGMLLLSLIAFDGSDASYVWELRKLVAVNPKDNTKTAIHGSPSPTPVSVPGDKKPEPNPVGETKMNKADPPSSNYTLKVAPKDSNNNNTPPSIAKKVNEKGHPQKNTTPASSPPPPPPPAVTKGDDDDGESHEEKKKEGRTNSLSNTNNENCDGLNTCRDLGDMVACISETGSKYVVVLVQNGGENTINVKLMESDLRVTEVAKHQTEKINVSLISSKSTQLTLNAGKGDCVLHMGPLVPKGDFFLRLPSYDKILTPVNGAYFLILTVLVFGGTWACCKLRRKRHDEVQYQELEMALPESVSATDVETAEGWDQGWDDDWDEDVAVKSPIHHAGSISANGLTSRSSNKDGWENNWDD